jgi:hypothetical protein
MQWYYSKNGSQLGPVEQGEILSKLASGEISPSDMVWREGMTDWLPVSKVNELAVIARPSGVESPPAAPPGGVMNSPYASPASGQGPAYGGAVIPNYLWQSIVVTIFCCWPLGIPAIVYAAKVDGLKSRGDIQGAMAASASAKTWCWAAGGIGGAVIIIWLLFVIFAAASGGIQTQ